MVVEDEDSIREVTAAWLSDEGFAVTTACNGADALRQLRHAWPDVIVLDLMMPVMDGWSFRAEQRAMGGAAAAVPVVVLSGARELDAAAVLSKPFNLDEVLATVQRVMSTRL